MDFQKMFEKDYHLVQIYIEHRWLSLKLYIIFPSHLRTFEKHILHYI